MLDPRSSIFLQFLPLSPSPPLPLALKVESCPFGLYSLIRPKDDHDRIADAETYMMSVKSYFRMICSARRASTGLSTEGEPTTALIDNAPLTLGN